MQLPQQLPRTLVALVVTYVLASVIEAVNLLSAVGWVWRWGWQKCRISPQVRLLIT